MLRVESRQNACSPELQPQVSPLLAGQVVGKARKLIAYKKELAQQLGGAPWQGLPGQGHCIFVGNARRLRGVGTGGSGGITGSQPSGLVTLR